MKIIPILILNIVIYTNSFSQTLETAWQRSFGGTEHDVLESIVPTEDGGCLIGGWSSSRINGEKTDTSRGSFDYWILKLNEQHDTVWQKTYGGTGSDKLMDIVLCNDGGFLLAGSSYSNISSEKSETSFGESDFWLLRIDSIGNIIWDKTIGGSGNDQLTGIINLFDDGYILGGTSTSDSSGLKTDNSEGYEDLWVLKINTIGDIIWQNTIGGDSIDKLYSINATIDNGILLGGDTKSSISGDKLTPLTGLWDFWMVKLDEFGNYEWDQSVGGNNQSAFGHAIQTLDGNYIIAGSSSCDTTGIKSEPAHNISLWAVKFNETGDVLWDKTIGGGTFDNLTDIIPTSDGGSLIASFSNSDSEYDKTEKSFVENFWIIKLSADGNIEWENTIVSHGDCRPTTIVEIEANEFLIGGSEYGQFSKEKNTNSHGENDFYLVNFHNCEPLDTSVTVIYSGAGYVLDIKSNADDVNYQWYDCNDPMGGGGI